MKLFKFALVAAALIAINPRVGGTMDGRIYVASCNAQAGVSIGAQGVWYARFERSNPFTGFVMNKLGC